MIAALLALSASVCWGAGDMLAGLASRRHDTWGVSLVSQTVGLAAGGVMLVALGRPWPGWAALVPALLAGVVLAGGMLAYFHGLSVGTMSIVAPIASACAVVPVAVGLAGGERPSALQAAGATAAVAGVMLAVYERDRTTSVTGTVEVGASAGGRPRPRNRLAAALAVVAAVSFGVVLVGFARTAAHDPFWPAVGGRMTSVATLVLAARLMRRRRAATAGEGGRVPAKTGREFTARDRPSARLLTGRRWGRAGRGRHRSRGNMPAGALAGSAVAGLFHLSAATLFSLASVRGLLSLVSVLSSLSAVIVATAAHLFLHERLAGHQRVGVVLALAGVLAIAGG